MASQGGDEFKEVLNDVMQKLKTDDNPDYIELETHPEELEKAEAEMKKTYDEFKTMMSNANSLEEALAHLSSERQTMIKTTFRLQSFNVDMQRQEDGSVNLLFASIEGTPLPFVPSIVKLVEENYEENHELLKIRIIFEIACMVLDFVGISPKPSAEAIGEANKFISTVLWSYDKILGDLDKMVIAAKEKDNSGIARNILAVLIDLFSIVGTPILRLVKIIVQDMSWFDIIITVCKALCFIATAIVSKGAAIVIRVISWLLSAAYFVNKLIQMDEFRRIK